MGQTAKETTKLPKFVRATLVPLSLLVLCPPTVFLFWHTSVNLGGSLQVLGQQFAEHGMWTTLMEIWRPVFWGTPTAWTIIAVFAAFELTLMRILPGKTFRGPITAGGHVPVYKANGVAAFAVSIAAFCIATFGLNLFPASIIYDNFGGLLGALNIFSLAFCAMLYLKGRFAPSGPDHSTTGNVIFDYYWGTELYPRVMGWDVKMFTNCRFGMMGWSLTILSFAAKQHALYGLSDSMLVAVAIQLVYIAKFFWWETGYLSSLDIMHDRAGFYICWGCLVWIPGVYTSHTLYLVHHPNQLGVVLASMIFMAGVASVFMNYAADAQRQRVRALNGKCKVWGKEPVLITANYRTVDGTPKQSILLASGWWGISRHFHYVPELLCAFFWSVPALFDNFLPYFYVSFLTVLLVHRAYRDDARCSAKYGKDWQRYCDVVPGKLLPLGWLPKSMRPTRMVGA